MKVATQVLHGANNPALFINVDGKKIYLNGNAMPDADGNLIGEITISTETVDSIKSPGTKIEMNRITSYVPQSLLIKQQENQLRLSTLTVKSKALLTLTDEQVVALNNW